MSPQPVNHTKVQFGGLPGLQYDDIKTEEPANGQSRLVFLFDGPIEYLVNCQSTPEKQAEVARACERVLTTMTKRKA